MHTHCYKWTANSVVRYYTDFSKNTLTLLSRSVKIGQTFERCDTPMLLMDD